MTTLIRTDRRVFSAPSTEAAAAAHPGAIVQGEWIDVDGPVPGALVIEWRAASSTEFIEMSTLARMQARLSLTEAGVPHDAVVEEAAPETEGAEPVQTTAVQQLERALLATLAARRSVVAVHGAPDDLRALLAGSPGRIIGELSIPHASAHGNRVLSSTLRPDPFVRAASGR